MPAQLLGDRNSEWKERTQKKKKAFLWAFDGNISCSRVTFVHMYNGNRVKSNLTEGYNPNLSGTLVKKTRWIDHRMSLSKQQGCLDNAGTHFIESDVFTGYIVLPGVEKSDLRSYK